LLFVAGEETEGSGYINVQSGALEVGVVENMKSILMQDEQSS